MQVVVPRFTVHRMLMTPGALVALVEAQEDPRSFVYRHIQGDWGDVAPDVWAENESAVKHGEPVLSVFHTRHGRTIWIVTEGSRYSTTIMLAGER